MPSDVIDIYTDGACQGNPGPGGWGVLLRYKGKEKELSGFVPNTTNNQMELMAAIRGLHAVQRTLPIHLHTDSEYVQKGITLWIQQWKRNGWKTAARTPVKNQELWMELDRLVQSHHVTWFWVKGHSDHPENDRVDQLAREAIEKQGTPAL